MFDPSNFQHFLEASPLPVWVYDTRDLTFVWANHAATRHYGYSLAQFRQMTILDIRPPAACQEVARLAHSAERSEANKPRVWQHLTRSGTLLDVRVTTVDLLPQGCGLRLALVEDVTSFTSMTQALEHMAHHDAGTGLLNPRALAQALDGGALGACYELANLRMQGLAEIAELFGGSVALSVTKQVILALQSGGTSALWGFQAPNSLLVASANPAQLRALVTEAKGCLARPVLAEGGQWQLALRCGVARFPQDGSHAEQVIACAGLAARTVAAGGGAAAPTVYTAALGDRSRRRRRLAVELGRAIRAEEIEVHFQPIVPAHAGPEAAARRKYEALSRWRLDGESISPAEFIPIAESSGLSKELLRLVIKQSLVAITTLRTYGIEGLVTINVPAIASVIADLPTELMALSEQYGVRPDRIGVEITESALIDDDAHWRKSFALLRYMGVHVAIDDFGTGFNSLSYLDRLPADVIKLDRTFIGQLFVNDRQALICASLIRLAHGLGLKVVAEGVEEEEQRQWLLQHQCDELQGYLMGRPVPLRDILRALDDARERVIAPGQPRGEPA
ncbi:EAL domain-containing protein [Stenotrophomonas sp. HITSZ_GD]|uniref:EAL domain-containing protein n=1 Tax=Stenotrophomonas sp. HITSZ_GD TaxID=3037248 RepID=UPI00240DFD4D|nr:EAL domain-containing protein [Stenotrophomonas sp. HITSZ_GD]MDG2526569.1 EAL domain-containing protein [Stenotrophomonas sp. HITSZ_GD]